MWEDPERRDRLAERYNRLFNSIVAAAYDGAHLTLPGLADTFTPHPHQRDAVWRILSEPTVLLGHAVGAGKTATMVMAGMECAASAWSPNPPTSSRTTCSNSSPPSSSSSTPPPGSSSPTSDATSPAARKHFVARCATGDWDAVIITHAAFERIPVSRRRPSRPTSPPRSPSYATPSTASKPDRRPDRQTARRRRWPGPRNATRSFSTPTKQDDGVSFEHTGIDYLFVDEAHAYKNLAFTTHIDGISGVGLAAGRGPGPQTRTSCANGTATGSPPSPPPPS